MTFTPRTLTALLLAGTTLLGGTAALAQSTSTASTGNPMYGTGNAYVELGVGRTDYSLGAGTGVFANEKRDTSYKVAAGSFFDRNVGFELGYTDFGSIRRGVPQPGDAAQRRLLRGRTLPEQRFRRPKHGSSGGDREETGPGKPQHPSMRRIE